MFGHISTYLRRIFPLIIFYLIAADMEHGTGEDRNHLICHLIQKFHYFRVSHIKNFIMYTEFAWYFDLFSARPQPRIRCDCCTGMSRHTHLRYYRNMAFSCIIHNFFQIFLCIKTAMTFTVIHLTSKMIDFRRIPESSYFRQLRILLYFDTPSLVISQMPMEDIHFQVCHFIQQLLHHFFTFEITTFIEHKGTPRKSRIVRNDRLL